MTSLAIVFTATLLGALYRRWFGGWPENTGPRWLKLLVGGVLAIAITIPFTQDPWLLIGAFLFLPLTMVPGHGSYMDMGSMPKPDNEFLKPILDIILGEEPYKTESKQQRRDIIGMATRYGVFTAVAGLAVGVFYSVPAGLIYAPMGLIPALGYWWAYEKIPDVRFTILGTKFLWGFTSFGELVLGACIYGGWALALAYL